jgi:hypothetical protein
MSYIGRQLNNLSDRVKLDSITASATATYNLLLNTVAYVPSSAESLTVSLNGVIQAPQDSYTVSGSTITFASTLSASDSIDFILAERSITLQTPSAGSVGLTQLSATGTKDATTFLRGDNTFATAGVTGISSSSSSTAISIDSNGHVTKPLQPAFYSNVPSNYNPGTDGNHTVTYSTEVYDVNADYNNSNYTFTAPVTGKYLISTAVRGYDVDATWSLAHSIVTSNRTYHNNTTRGQQDQYISTIVVVADMDASDTAFVRINANESAFQISGDTYSYFTAALIC